MASSPGRALAAADPPAVLLGGGPTAVPVARSLAGDGVAVHALGWAGDPLQWSRCGASFVDLGRERPQDRWLDWLEGAPAGAVLLPCSDDGLELVARHRAELQDRGLIPIEADDEVVLTMLDKHRTYALARERGIPVPLEASVKSANDLEQAAGRFGYPCALKPAHSHLFARHFAVKAFVAHDADELREAFARVEPLGLEMVLMEIVAPEHDECRSYYSYLDERGEPLLHVTKRKLRQYPIGFGNGCFHMTDWDPEVAEAGLRFFQALGVRGLACVELKRGAAGGPLKVIECNHRFTAATELLRACGVDLTLFTYNRLLGRPTPAVARYRTGVGLWYPIQDTLALRLLRRSGRLSLRGWLRSLMRPLRFPVARLSDPLPTLAVNGRFLWEALCRRRPFG